MSYCRRWIHNRLALSLVMLGIGVLLPAPLPAQGTVEQLAIWTFDDGAPPYEAGIPIDPKTEDVNGTPTLRLLNADVDRDGEVGVAFNDSEGVAHFADSAAGWTDIAKSGDNDADLRIAIDTTGWQSLNLRLNYRSQLANNYDLEFSFNETTWTKALDNQPLTANNTFNVLTVPLPAAIANQATVFLRIVDLDSGPGNGQFYIDNLEITGNRIDPNAPVLTVATSTTRLLSLPTAGSGFASGVISDPTDPAAVLGIDFVLSDADTALADLVVTASSNTPAVVPSTSSNLVLSGSGGTRNLKIIPTGVGFARITITVQDTTGKTGSYQIDYAASAAAPTPANARFHSGISDASAALAVDATTMLVANDEDQPLRLYSRSQSGLPVASFDFSTQLNLLVGGGEVDIEGVTRVGNRVYWISSHGNNSSGELRPNRQRLFATDLSGSGAAATLSFVGGYSALRDNMVAWDQGNGHGLGADFLGLSASAALGKAPEAPAGDGWNIEGLALAPNSTTTAYVGFRAPLTPSSNRTKALIIPVTNFSALADGSANAATFGAPIELDLGGRGIRSIERNASNQYLIVAGPVAEATGVAPSDFRLFTWSGNPADAPQLQPVNLTALTTRGSFEAIVEVPNPLSAAVPVQLVNDNGGSDWYGSGVESKTLTPNFQKFRSDLITLTIATPDTTPPNVTINQATDQADPATSGPIRFTVVFSEAVTGFTAADVTLSGTASGTLTATVTGSGPTYTVSVSGMSGPGTVSATIPAGAAQDAAGNPSLAATSTDTTVTFAPPLTTGTKVYLPLVRAANP